MQLLLHEPNTHFFITSCSNSSCTVSGQVILNSFLLNTKKLINPWDVTHANQLSDSHVQPILELQADVILLGTGCQLTFPPPSFLACFLTRKIGIEVMTNSAAARTFNVLANEGRRVAAAFIFSANHAAISVK
jgi:uncharacterized protein